MIKVRNLDVYYTETGHTLTSNNLSELRFGSSIDEIIEKVGEPNGWHGSGLVSPYYSLGEGEYAILRFNSMRYYENFHRIDIVDDSKVLETIELNKSQHCRSPER